MVVFWILAGLLMPPLAAVTALALGCRKRPTWRRVALTALILPLAFPLIGGFGHQCGRGQPDHLIFVGFSSIAAVLLFVSSTQGTAALTIALGLLTAWAAGTYSSTVHLPEWAGDSEGRQERLIREARLEAARRELRNVQGEDLKVRPAGRLADVDVKVDGRPLLELHGCEGETVESDRLWHTPLTRLWRRRARRVELHHEGGTLAQIAERLEWRPVP